MARRVVLFPPDKEKGWGATKIDEVLEWMPPQFCDCGGEGRQVQRKAEPVGDGNPGVEVLWRLSCVCGKTTRKWSRGLVEAIHNWNKAHGKA